MANNKNNSKQNEAPLPQEVVAFLDSIQLEYEDDNKDFQLSPSFGKKKPLIVRMVVTAHWAVVNFIFDVFVATRAIIREIV